MHNTDMGKRQGSNRCGLPVTRTEIAARKCRTKAATCQGGRERGCGAGGARRFGHTSHVLPKGETTKHALQATPHNTLNWMLWLSANGIGIAIEMRREWDSMEAAKQLCILQCIAMWEICARTAQRAAKLMQSLCEFRYII